MAVVGPPIWQTGVWADTVWAEGVWEDEAASSEVLAAGDLTTAFVKWLATKSTPKNEVIRAALNTEYSTSNPDLQPLLAKFLKERT